MNAVELRAPARAGRVTWHYLRLLRRRRFGVVMVFTFLLGMMSSVSSDGFEGFALFTPLMVMLPLVQWGTSARRGESDPAMPLGQARHELLRAAAGAAWAVAAMIPPLALLTLLLVVARLRAGGAVEGIAWFPPVLLASGVTFYLLGAAAWLRGARSGMLLCVLFGVQVVPVALLGHRWPRVERLLALREPLAPGQGAAWMVAAVLAVAAAGALVWMVAGAYRWLPGMGASVAPARPLWPARRAAATLAAGGPRRPARLRALLWGELRLLRGPTLAGVAIAIACTLWLEPALVASGAIEGAGYKWTVPLVHLSLWWPAVVWLRGRGPWRRSLEPVPASALAMRFARLVAGALCLEVVVLAAAVAHAVMADGGLRLPAGSAASFAGAACGALLLYLMGSFPLVVARDHLLGWTVMWVAMLLMIILPVLTQLLPQGRLRPWAPSSMFLPQPGPWFPVMLLLIAIVAGFLIEVTRIGVSDDRAEPLPVR